MAEGALQTVLSKFSNPEKDGALTLSSPRDPTKMPKTGPTAKIGALCTAENCSRLAVLRWPGEEKDSRCTHHGEKGMLSRTFLCARDDLQCFKHARYGWPGQSVTHCEIHKEEGMVANDRESKRFTKPTEQAVPVPPDEERCTFYSRDFGIGQQRRCKRPRKEGYKQCEHHVELRRRRAQKAKEGTAVIPTIEAPPPPDEQRCTYWAQHPLRGRVQCKRERMPDGILCEMHSKNADRRKMCWVEGCQRTGSNGVFGFSLRLACSWHTACGMIGKKDTYDRCFKLGCAARATMGPEGSVMPMLCKEHADPSMAILHPEGNNLAPPKVLNQPKKEELEALKEWNLVEQWVAKYTASPIVDAEQYRQDAYQLITRQRAEKMETFVRVKKPPSTPKPRRSKEELEAAAEERKRLAAEKDGWKAELTEKRQQVQLAREQKEAEKKRLAAEKAAQKAQAAAEKAAAKRAAAEKAAAERAANGTGARKRKNGEGGGAPKKRAKQMADATVAYIVDVDPSELNQALPVAAVLQDSCDGGSSVHVAGELKMAGPQRSGEPSSGRENVLGGFVYQGPVTNSATGTGIGVGPIALEVPAANGTAAAIEGPANLAPGTVSGRTDHLPTPMDVTEADAVPGGSPPVAAAPAASSSPAVPGAAPAVAQPPPQLLVLGKVYKGIPPEDVYDWGASVERQEGGSAVSAFACSFPGCGASKLVVNNEGAPENVLYKGAHTHAPGPMSPPVEKNAPISAGSPPQSTQRPVPPARRSHLNAPIQVVVPTAVYLQQQQMQAGLNRPIFRPILPRPVPKAKPAKKRAGKQDMDVLFVEECARVFKPAGEQGLSRDEVKSFLSKWSKFPLDTEEGQVKLQQALECGLFEEVPGGRYKLRDAQGPVPPPAEQPGPKKPEEVPGAIQAAHSEHAAAMLKSMGLPAGSTGAQGIPPKTSPNGEAAGSHKPQGTVPNKTANGVKEGLALTAQPQADGKATAAGRSAATSQAAPATPPSQLPEEPAVLALGAPNPQLAFPALSPPISELLLGDEERAARDSLPLSEEEEAMLRKLTVRKLQARRSMVPAWLRESVTAGAERLAWLQARKDRMQGAMGEKRPEAERGSAQEGVGGEGIQNLAVEQAVEVELPVAGQVANEGRPTVVNPPAEIVKAAEAGGRPKGSNPAGASNLDIGDIPFDFPAVEDLPGDQNWLTSPTAGFLGFAPDFQEPERGQAQTSASGPSAEEGARARIPQRKGPPEALSDSGLGPSNSGLGPSEAAEAAPEQTDVREAPAVENEMGTAGVMVYMEKGRVDRREMQGAPKKRKWVEIQEEEMMRRMTWTPEEEAMQRLLECRETPQEPATGTQEDTPSAV